VTLGPETGYDIVVEKGLEAGETVIVEGLQKVRPGMVVNPVPAG
jgi:membrane fusion protein (multidrug efflux system)